MENEKIRIKIMNKKGIIKVGAILVLVIAAGLVFFRLHQNMLNEHETPKTSQEEALFKDITADQLSDMLKNKDFLLINVHSPYLGEIGGTDDFIYPGDIKEGLSGLPDNKDAKIVVYCRSGGMSRVAAENLAKIGYTNVSNLLGGMIGWEQAGYKLDFIEANRK